MLVSKDYDKHPVWSEDASDLDNIAYQLYLDDNLYKGVTIYPQNIIKYIYQKYPQDDMYYGKALKILRKQKLYLLNENR